jgi:hypothetical protein
MGEPISRLNPKIESRMQKVFLLEATKLLLFVATMLPIKKHKKRGQQPYDYRIIMVLCILRILLRKTYADYEIEMRTDPRICKLLELQILPGKSTIQRGLELLSIKTLIEFNQLMLADWMKRKLNLMLDASGIKLIGRSIWYAIRIKKPILRRDCDKIHLAACSDVLLIVNWEITDWKKHDSPFLKILLVPFKILGLVFADTGYSSRKNIQLIADKKGGAFIPFNKKATGKPKSCPAWKHLHNLWTKFRTIFDSVYHQRSKIETIFSVLKKRFGDMLYSKNKNMQHKEMSLRFIAYNVRVFLYWRYAMQNSLNLWVKA